MVTRVRLEGDRELDRRLEDLAAAAGDLEPAAAQVGGFIADRARPPVRTGRLAASLESTTVGSTAVVGSSLVYAGVIHGGWPRRGIAPNPFLLEPAERHRDGWLALYADHLDRALDS